MKKQKKYTVVWRNEVIASSKKDAAKDCKDMITEGLTIFEVAKGFVELKNLGGVELTMIEV